MGVVEIAVADVDAERRLLTRAQMPWVLRLFRPCGRLAAHLTATLQARIIQTATACRYYCFQRRTYAAYIPPSHDGAPFLSGPA